MLADAQITIHPHAYKHGWMKNRVESDSRQK